MQTEEQKDSPRKLIPSQIFPQGFFLKGNLNKALKIKINWEEDVFNLLKKTGFDEFYFKIWSLLSQIPPPSPIYVLCEQNVDDALLITNAIIEAFGTIYLLDMDILSPLTVFDQTKKDKNYYFIQGDEILRWQSEEIFRLTIKDDDDWQLNCNLTKIVTMENSYVCDF